MTGWVVQGGKVLLEMPWRSLKTDKFKQQVTEKLGQINQKILNHQDVYYYVIMQALQNQ